MYRRLLGSVTNGLLAAGVVYCSVGLASWVTNTCAIHTKITNERGSRPTIMIDEDLLVSKKRVFGQDRVLLAQDIEFWNFLRDKSGTHAICIRQKGVVPTGVLKQLCLNMNLPITTKLNSRTPWCSHILLQQNQEKLDLRGLAKKVKNFLPLHSTQLPGTTIYLQSRAETHYLPRYYNKLVDNQPCRRIITLLEEIAELEILNEKNTEPEYPFYTQGALRLSVSQRLLREPSISMLQDRL